MNESRIVCVLVLLFMAGALHADVYPERAAPQIVIVDPGQYELNVVQNTSVTAAFNIAIDESSINSSTVFLCGMQSGPHVCLIGYDNISQTVTLDPYGDFVDGEMVTVSLTKEIQASNGIYFQGYSWSFRIDICMPSTGNMGGLRTFATGAEPRGVYAADYDLDGDIDLAISSSNYPFPGQIAILMNQEYGNFARPVLYSLSEADPFKILACDINGDGDVDLAIVHNEPGTSHLSVLTNKGDGTFLPAGTYVIAILGKDLCGSDFDADGDIDLVVTDGFGSSNNVRILWNNGDGSFGNMQTYTAGGWAGEVIAEDVDNDGDMDMIVAGEYDKNVVVFYNDGYGTFPTILNYSTGNSTSRLFGDDLNGDGWVDLVGGGRDHVSIILNNGDGTYGNPTTNSLTNTIWSVVGGDIDGDGDIDIAASLVDSYEIWILLNNGNGVFNDERLYAVGDCPTGVQLADFDLDGDLDLCSAIYNEDQVYVLYNNVIMSIDEVQEYDPTTGDPISPSLDQEITVEGVVFVKKGTHSSGGHYIQDASGGINFYDQTAVALSLGDSIRITGPLWNHHGELYVGWPDITILAHVDEVEPKYCTLPQLVADYENIGMFVKTTGLVSEATVDSFQIESGVTSIWVYRGQFDHVSFDEVSVGLPVRVSSPCMVINGVMRLSPRIQSDLRILTPTEMNDPLSVSYNVCLRQNVPNPFNPQTTIRFQLPYDMQVSLKIYDLSGRLIRNLVHFENMNGGDHQAVWNGKDNYGRDVSAAVYFYRLDSGEMSVTKRMVMVK